MEPFIGEIRLLPYNFEPAGWIRCDGRKLTIQDYQALNVVLGGIYGGDGRTYFNIPNLTGFALVGVGGPNGTVQVDLGKNTGSNSVTLKGSQLASHSHALNGATTNTAQSKQTVATTASQLSAVTVPPAITSQTVVSTATSPLASFAPGMIGNDNTNTNVTAHENRQPFLDLCFMIATTGVWPPRPE